MNPATLLLVIFSSRCLLRDQGGKSSPKPIGEPAIGLLLGGKERRHLRSLFVRSEYRGMGFLSFAGRVLFAAIFILAAWQKVNDFGEDGGGAMKMLNPKFATFKSHVHNTLGFDLPEVQTKLLLMIAIGLEGIGGILFIFGSSLGAYMLLIFLAAVTPIMHDFYNYDFSSSDYVLHFMQFLKNLSLFGALLFFLGMKNYTLKRLNRTKSIKTKSA
ncbi:hypothetical protein R1flu_001646 [Riccia fluitans]|uniref:DoxX family protein n=1 Tax=Riccia fluitans TaxID=41844 RepID=A0ABD1Y3V4_9MARC